MPDYLKTVEHFRDQNSSGFSRFREKLQVERSKRTKKHGESLELHFLQLRAAL